MSNEIVPEDKPKPTFSEFIESWLPFQLPKIPLPQAAKNLDKAIGRLIGTGGDALEDWIERYSERAKARNSAEITFIRAGAKAVTRRIGDGDVDLEARAIESALQNHVLRQKNTENVVKFAAAELLRAPPCNDATTEINDDWLNAFHSLASDKSSEDMQSLWGKLLAGEVKKPGTFKLRSLHALSLLETADAKLIHMIMDLVIWKSGVYHGAQNEYLSSKIMLELEHLGVLQSVNSRTKMNFPVEAHKPVLIACGEKRALRVICERTSNVEIPNVVPLTRFGRDLYALCMPINSRSALLKEIGELLSRQGCSVEVVTLGAVTKVGTRQIISRDGKITVVDENDPI